MNRSLRDIPRWAQLASTVSCTLLVVGVFWLLVTFATLRRPPAWLVAAELGATVIGAVIILALASRYGSVNRVLKRSPVGNVGPGASTSPTDQSWTTEYARAIFAWFGVGFCLLVAAIIVSFEAGAWVTLLVYGLLAGGGLALAVFMAWYQGMLAESKRRRQKLE